MLYNIFFEVSALAFLIIINIYIRLQYNSKPLTNRRYKRLALVMLIAVAMDIITAVTISFSAAVPVWLNMLLNFLYFCSDIILEYHFVTYCAVYVYEKLSKKLIYALRAVSGLTLALLLVNFPTGIVFSFDENGYIHGPLYMIVHAVPLTAIAVSIAILFSGFKKFNTSKRVAVIVYAAVVFGGSLVQMFFPNVLFTLFAVSIGFMMLISSLETPDYQALMRTMDELRKARDDAEEARAEAQRANEVKTEFLTGISHEIRTPINAIIGYAEAVRKESRDEKTMRYSGNVLSAGKTLLAIVTEIMDYIELEGGDFRLEQENYSTASFIMDMIACGGYYTEKTEGKSLEFRPTVAENIPAVLVGDCPRLGQIVNNLLSNAAKYTESGYVELRIGWEAAEDGKGYLTVSVTDSGTGMKEENVARISESFLRMDKLHNRNIQGIGLGLTIVTRLLAYMDSRLEVSSEYGKGTSVRFRVLQTVTDSTPLGPMKYGPEMDMTVKNGLGFKAPSARILAVDDNRMNLELICRALREAEAEADIGMNGKEAVELVKRNNYDIIFMDHMMPVMDGAEAMKTMRENNYCPGVPIIVVTANAVSGEREKYLEMGFDDYISKPFTASRVCEVLRRHLPEELVIMDSEVKESAREERKSSLSETIGKLDFLDTASGMAYCCGDEDFYIQILATYLSEDKSAAIVKTLDEGDMENYRITVHALKGTSRTIGADAVSEMARKLEQAARENDIAYIRTYNGKLLEEYGRLLDNIKKALQEVSG